MVDQITSENEARVIDYILLSDSEATVINRYGLLNQIGPGGRAIPYPTTYVINKDGIIEWKMTEIDYRIRPENEDILNALGNVGF